MNVDLPQMAQILRFIYTDTVKPADVPQALQLVELSRYYGLSGLRLACQDYICSRVCLDNVVEVRLLLSLSSRSDSAVVFARVHLSRVITRFGTSRSTKACPTLPRSARHSSAPISFPVCSNPAG
jgi:hypothetical protein